MSVIKCRLGVRHTWRRRRADGIEYCIHCRMSRDEAYGKEKTPTRKPDAEEQSHA